MTILRQLWNFRDGIPTVDQFGCAKHEVLYATAGSNLCHVADPQHVEAISGNARQVSKHHLYRFVPPAKQTTDVIIASKCIKKNSDQMPLKPFCRKESTY